MKSSPRLDRLLDYPDILSRILGLAGVNIRLLCTMENQEVLSKVDESYLYWNTFMYNTSSKGWMQFMNERFNSNGINMRMLHNELCKAQFVMPMHSERPIENDMFYEACMTNNLRLIEIFSKYVFDGTTLRRAFLDVIRCGCLDSLRFMITDLELDPTFYCHSGGAFQLVIVSNNVAAFQFLFDHLQLTDEHILIAICATDIAPDMFQAMIKTESIRDVVRSNLKAITLKLCDDHMMRYGYILSLKFKAWKIAAIDTLRNIFQLDDYIADMITTATETGFIEMIDYLNSCGELRDIIDNIHASVMLSADMDSTGVDH